MLKYSPDKSLCAKQNHKSLPILLICNHKQCDLRLQCSFCSMNHMQNIKDHDAQQNLMMIQEFLKLFNKKYEQQQQKYQQNQNQIQEQEYAVDKIFKVYLEEIISKVEQIKFQIKQQLFNNEFALYNFVQNNAQQIKGQEICELSKNNLDALIILLHDQVANNDQQNNDFQKIRQFLEEKLQIWQKSIIQTTNQLLDINLEKQFNNKIRQIIQISNDPQCLEKVTIGSSYGGKLCQDSFDQNNKKVYRFPSYAVQNKIFIYENIDLLRESINNCKEITLSTTILGTNQAVFNNHVYSQIISQDSKTIGKISLSDFQLKIKKQIDDSQQKQLTTYSGYNNFMFFSEPNSLYVGYFSTTNNDKLKIVELNPETLENIKEWIIETPQKQFGFLFMLDGILYGGEEKDSAKSPIKFTFSYDIKTNKSNIHEIKEFLNKGGNYDTSLHFNYQQNQLWTVNMENFYIYDLQLQ